MNEMKKIREDTNKFTYTSYNENRIVKDKQDYFIKQNLKQNYRICGYAVIKKI